MKNTFKALILATALTATIAQPAMAYPGYYHHHNHVGLALGIGAGVLAGTALYLATSPYYYGPAYYTPYPAPVAYYAQPPVVYAQPPQEVYQQPQPVMQQPAPQQVSMADNSYCREYDTMSRINGVITPTHGTACYQPDGSWQIVN